MDAIAHICNHVDIYRGVGIDIHIYRHIHIDIHICKGIGTGINAGIISGKYIYIARAMSET